MFPVYFVMMLNVLADPVSSFLVKVNPKQGSYFTSADLHVRNFMKL